jgi:hypothetical protein
MYSKRGVSRATRDNASFSSSPEGLARSAIRGLVSPYNEGAERLTAEFLRRSEAAAGCEDMIDALLSAAAHNDIQPFSSLQHALTYDPTKATYLYLTQEPMLLLWKAINTAVYTRMIPAAESVALNFNRYFNASVSVELVGVRLRGCGQSTSTDLFKSPYSDGAPLTSELFWLNATNEVGLQVGSVIAPSCYRAPDEEQVRQKLTELPDSVTFESSAWYEAAVQFARTMLLRKDIEIARRAMISTVMSYGH